MQRDGSGRVRPLSIPVAVLVLLEGRMQRYARGIGYITGPSLVAVLVLLEGRMQLDGRRSFHQPGALPVAVLVLLEGRMQLMSADRQTRRPTGVAVLVLLEGRMQLGNSKAHLEWLKELQSLFCWKVVCNDIKLSVR